MHKSSEKANERLAKGNIDSFLKTCVHVILLTFSCSNEAKKRANVSEALSSNNVLCALVVSVYVEIEIWKMIYSIWNVHFLFKYKSLIVFAAEMSNSKSANLFNSVAG